jgi:hypothetical protein
MRGGFVGISALIVIIFTIIYILGNEKMKRIHQLHNIQRTKLYFMIAINCSHKIEFY